MNVTKEFIKELSPEYSSKWPQIEDKLYARINQRWQDKKKNAINNITRHISQQSGYYIDNETANVIVQIAYNVHILGDYSDTIIKPLAPVQDIRNELIECINKLDVNKRTKKRAVIDRMNKAAQKLKTDDARNAKALLEVLQQELPSLIEASPNKYRKPLWGN